MLTVERKVNNAEVFAAKLDGLFSVEEKRFLAKLLRDTFKTAFGSDDIIGAGVFELEGNDKLFVFYWAWNETTNEAEVQAFWFERDFVSEKAALYRAKQRRTVHTVDSIIIARNLGQEFVNPTVDDLANDEYSMISRDYQEAA